MKKNLAVLFLFTGSVLTAKEPEKYTPFVKAETNTHLVQKDVRMTYRITTTQNTLEKSHTECTSINKVNATFVADYYAVKETHLFAQLLKWDCKVKFKLTRNMNILISYN